MPTKQKKLENSYMLIQIRNPLIPKYLHETCLIDANGIPRFWSSVWALFHLPHVSENTKIKKLFFIESLYSFVEKNFGANTLDEAIATIDVQKLSEVLESFFVSICNREDFQSTNNQMRWRTVYRFILDLISKIRSESSGAIFNDLNLRVRKLEHLYRQLHVNRSKQQALPRALPSNVLIELDEMLNPLSPNNPFDRDKTRWTVYVIFLCLLRLGLRSAELHMLRVDAVKSGYSKEKNEEQLWLNIEELPKDINDPRFPRPQIKNSHSLRQLPVPRDVAKIIQIYIENYRGAPDHPFLLNSAKNTPLSLRASQKMFQKISKSLPPEIVKELKDKTGKETIIHHLLRHSSAVAKLEVLASKGIEPDFANQILRATFGWSRDSNMPILYARGYYEKRNAEIFEKITDEHQRFLRATQKTK